METEHPHFQVFRDIRQRLKENYIKLEDFPIVEIDPSKKSTVNYLGFTYINFTPTISIKKVAIKIRDVNGEVFHLLRLIPTLLHEFAHCLQEVNRDYEDLELRSKKIKRMDKHQHDKVFYQYFRQILIVAEGLGIYKLPARPNKFTQVSLQRFDSVDLYEAPINMCGSSDLINELENNNIDNDEIKETILRLLVSDSHGKQKMIILKNDEITTENVLKQGARKLNMKLKPTKIITQQGLEIDETNINTLESDTIVILRN